MPRTLSEKIHLSSQVQPCNLITQRGLFRAAANDTERKLEISPTQMFKRVEKNRDPLVANQSSHEDQVTQPLNIGKQTKKVIGKRVWDNGGRHGNRTCDCLTDRNMAGVAEYCVFQTS